MLYQFFSFITKKKTKSKISTNDDSYQVGTLPHAGLPAARRLLAAEEATIELFRSTTLRIHCHEDGHDGDEDKCQQQKMTKPCWRGGKSSNIALSARVNAVIVLGIEISSKIGMSQHWDKSPHKQAHQSIPDRLDSPQWEDPRPALKISSAATCCTRPSSQSPASTLSCIGIVMIIKIIITWSSWSSSPYFTWWSTTVSFHSSLPPSHSDLPAHSSPPGDVGRFKCKH